MKYLVILYVTVFAGCISADSIKWTDCGSKANVTDIRVSGCSSQPCIFYKNHEYSIEVDAVSPLVTNTLPFKVTAHVIFDVTLLKGNACDDLTEGACPTSIGESITYKSQTIHIAKVFPSISTTVRAIVLDDKNDKMVCAELAAKIKNTPKYDLYLLMKFVNRKNQEKFELTNYVR